jgi:hypothetical protein
MLLAAFSHVLSILQTIIAQTATLLLVGVYDLSITIKVDVCRIIFSVELQFLVEMFEGRVISLHRFHFFHHFLEDLGRMLSCVDGRKGLESICATVHDGIL